MERPLAGRLILVAEDEPVIALDISQAFEDAGAGVIRAHTLEEALLAAEDPALSAAIMDHALSDRGTSKVCERLKERNIAFVTFSGHDDIDVACRGGVLVKKPVSTSVLVETVKNLLAGRQISN